MSKKGFEKALENPLGKKNVGEKSELKQGKGLPYLICGLCTNTRMRFES